MCIMAGDGPKNAFEFPESFNGVLETLLKGKLLMDLCVSVSFGAIAKHLSAAHVFHDFYALSTSASCANECSHDNEQCSAASLVHHTRISALCSPEPLPGPTPLTLTLTLTLT